MILGIISAQALMTPGGTEPPSVTIQSLETTEAQPALSGSVSGSSSVVVTISGTQYAASVVGGTWSVPSGVVFPVEPGDTPVTVTATIESGVGTASATITRTLLAINIGAVQG